MLEYRHDLGIMSSAYRALRSYAPLANLAEIAGVGT
jgi:hypothetical protein